MPILVNTPMDRLRINTRARCTSVAPLEKQYRKVTCCLHAVGTTEYLSFSPSAQQALPPSLCPLVCCGDWQNCTARQCQAELSSILHQCNKFSIIPYCLPLNFPPNL